MITALNSTTYKADNLGDVKPSIIIGGSGDKFVPNITMSFHGDEFFINLNRKDKIVTTQTASLSADKISQKIGDDTDEYYIKDGRLKWDIVFDKCPASMNIDFELTISKGIGFYFQGELSAEDIADGCVRPDDIKNSYAVYCNKKNNKYKTGKIAHITRPFVIDTKGKKEWCALKVEAGVLKITLPDKFMTDAVYPVRLDPTFGYTSNGATQASHYTSSKPIGSVNGAYTAGAGESITKFSIYTHLQDAGNTDINAAAYTVSGTVLDARLSNETAVPVTSTDLGWFHSAAVSIAMTEGNVYGMAVCVYGESNDVYLYWDNIYQNDYTRHNTAAVLPATWTSDTNTNRTYSFYVTYEESGGTAYIRSISDSVGLTDSLTRIINFSRSISNTEGITDVLTRASSKIRAIANTAGITDAASRAVTFIRSIANSVGITDVLSRTSAKIRAISNTISISDIVSRASDKTRSISNAVGITDILTGVKGIIRSISDSIGVSDVLSRLSTYKRTIVNSIKITEVLNRTGRYKRKIQNSIGIVDVLVGMLIIIIWDFIFKSKLRKTVYKSIERPELKSSVNQRLRRSKKI